MSHWLPALWTAVNARLAGDTGTGGLFNATTPLVTSVYNGHHPPVVSGTSYPYLIFQVSGASNTDGFSTASREVGVEIHSWIDRAPLSGSYAPETRAAAILERIEGDWMDQSSGEPTYGLHRFLPVLSGTPWVASVIEYVDINQDHDDALLHYITLFRVRVSRKQPS